MPHIPLASSEKASTASTPAHAFGSAQQFNKSTHSHSRSPAEYLYPDVLREVFKQCLRQSSQILNAPYPIPPESSESTRLDTRIQLTLCHVCSHWRAVALSTGELWGSLSHEARIRPCYEAIFGSDSDVESDDEALGPFPTRVWAMAMHPNDISFLRWWGANVRGSNLALKLRLKQTEYKLDRRDNLRPSDMLFLVDLVKRARFLSLDPFYTFMIEDLLDGCPVQNPSGFTQIIPSMSTLRSTAPIVRFDNLESLIVDGAKPLTSIPFGSDMPALRKLFVSSRLTDPLKVWKYSTNTNFTASKVIETWSQLTHLSIFVETTVDQWATFFQHCKNLQDAKVTLKLRNSYAGEPVKFPQNVVIFANLLTLSLNVEKFRNISDISKIFVGQEFTALRSWNFKCPHISLEYVNLLLKTMPTLRNLQLKSKFPAIYPNIQAADLDDEDLRRHIRVGFPDKASFSGYQSHRNKLATFVPLLERLVLDTPCLPQYARSCREYVNGMLSCGWLDGISESTTKKRLDLQFTVPLRCKRYSAMIHDLQQYLPSRSRQGTNSSPTGNRSTISGHIFRTPSEVISADLLKDADVSMHVGSDIGSPVTEMVGRLPY